MDDKRNKGVSVLDAYGIGKFGEHLVEEWNGLFPVSGL
jgi:hypothetical protein